jgi:hypothetical protein
VGGVVGDGEDYVPEQDSDEEEEEQGDDDGGEEGEGKKGARKGFGARANSKKGNAALSGGMYKAKKAQGDLKRGKYDPFSYVKLDPKNLNRRRAGHTADQFSDMFDRRRPGIKKGHKHVGKKSGGGRFYSK